MQKLLFLKWPVMYSKIVTTISENTKKDIVDFSGCSPDKVKVIPNPLPCHFLFSDHVFRKECPVLLFVGTTPNKNLEKVIEAIKNIPCVLHIIGKVPAHEEELLKKNGIEYRSSFSLSEDELKIAYTEADIVLFPSLFEGFGLPILEGQLTGRPVITSRIDPMKDVAGDGACLVDPQSVQSIRAGILTVIEDEEYRNELIKKGLINLKRFNTDTIAGKYFELYKQIAG